MTDKTTLDILVEGRARIADEANWHKGSYAEIKDDGTTCFCSLGALEVETVAIINGDYTDIRGDYTDIRFREAFDDDGRRTPVGKAVTALRKSLPFGHPYSIPGFNDDDDTTHADVLALFDRAIERATIEAAIEKLQAGRERISTPDTWAKGVFGMYDCFCALGAVDWQKDGCPNDNDLGPRPLEVTALYEALPSQFQLSTGADGWLVADFNDHENTTHEQVLELFDTAIANLKEKIA